MKQWKRLFYYLLLNIVVSACTTFLVLSAWDRTHTAMPGGVLSSFSLRPSAPSQTASPAAPVETPVPAASPTPVFLVYQVVAGDTFESIANAYGVSVDELIAVNGFTKNQVLGAGEVLRIPVTPTPGPEAQVEIVNVIGVGDLDSERVVLRQAGPGELLFAGWQLEDEQGHVFSFPTLEIARDGFEVNIYTKAGINTAGNLYWGLDQAAWQSGERVTLLDASGEVRGTYDIP